MVYQYYLMLLRLILFIHYVSSILIIKHINTDSVFISGPAEWVQSLDSSLLIHMENCGNAWQILLWSHFIHFQASSSSVTSMLQCGEQFLHLFLDSLGGKWLNKMKEMKEVTWAISQGLQLQYNKEATWLVQCSTHQNVDPCSPLSYITCYILTV